MKFDDIKYSLEVMSEIIPQVSDETKPKLFNVLSFLKQDYAYYVSKQQDENNEDNLVNEFKATIKELDLKLKDMGYGTRGYILVYAAAKDILHIDVYQIKAEMEKKFSKNKASNILRALVLAKNSYLETVHGLAKIICQTPEDYTKYLNSNKDDDCDDQKVNISSRADNIITESMVKESHEWMKKNAKQMEYQFDDDEIPF